MKYRLYIDEVGNPDLESSDNPNHRFLSLTGVIIELDYVQDKLYPELEKLKENYFKSHPDDPVIFHRKEMVNCKYPFEILRDSTTKNRFDAELLKHLVDWEYSVITVCIDKKSHKENYTTWRYNPYHYCLAVMMERYIFFLDQHGCVGDVIAESRGGKEDRRLKESFLGLWVNGTDYVEPHRFNSKLTSKQLKVKSKKNNISGLQLADIIAHPSRNEILFENGLLSGKIALFASKIIDIRASCKNSFFMMDVGMVQQYFSVFKLGGYFINEVIVFTLLFARK